MQTETDIAASTLAPVPEQTPRKLTSQKLGEELPIFCERCGYSLNGLPQSRCADCKILHFHCPECGHHQPINTLRPAAQRILGRLRALWLCLAVFFKLNFFGWLLFAWVAMGVEWSYRWNYHGNRAVTVVGSRGSTRTVPQYTVIPRELDLESLAAFGCFGLSFGLVGRMLLLRWRRGYLVGLVMAGLMLAAVMGGAKFRQLDLKTQLEPYTRDFMMVALIGASMIVIGAWIVWPIWMVLVRLLLPVRTGTALLEWQRGMSNRVGKLAQE
jgi:hypothetical protein